MRIGSSFSAICGWLSRIPRKCQRVIPRQVVGSMARTGLMFVISGVFLIGFGLFLEHKRRALVRQIRLPAAPP